MSDRSGNGNTGWRMIDLPRRDDRRGGLVYAEGTRDIPFAIARVYFLHSTPPGEIRGRHAHAVLEQVLIAASGRFDVRLDNGTARETITLDDPASGLYLSAMVWRELIDFAPGSVCLVLASAPYDEGDYYRDYDGFRAAVGGGPS